MVLRLYEEVKPDYIFACFDLPKPTFRHLSYEAYKGGRSKTDDALIEQIKEAETLALALNIPAFKQEGFEADDLLGTLAELLKQEKDTQVIIASGDMDTFQLIDNDKVVVYTLKKGNSAALFTEKDVIERYGFAPHQIPDYKGFAGDSSDNIIGIKGIGEKTATALIKFYGSVEGVYQQIKSNRQDLLDKGFSERITSLIEEGEDDAIFSKTLATIRRDAPITYEEPQQPWIDGIQKEVYEAMCDKYEFRSLKYKIPEKEGGNKKEALVIDDSTLRELQVMTNLLHSEMTNPSFDDIKSLHTSSSVADLQQSLVDDLKKNNLYTLFLEIEKPIMHILDKMHASGISLNVPFLFDLSKELHTQTKKLEKEIHTLAGQEFNISSPKQLGDILYTTMNLGTRIKKTKTGQKSTNISELEKIKDEHAIVPLVIEYRELSKLLSTYIDPLPTFVKEDGRVHARFIQTGASTGRFSCEDPNLQNLPVKSDIGKKVREAFIAQKGKVLLSCDYAQIDLRSAAILSGDKHLIEIFEKGIDVHTGTAAKVFKVKEGDVTQEMRRHAKAINFGILYGMGVTALKEGMGVERKEAQMFYDEYKNTFTRLMEYLEEVKREAWDKGYTSTLLGRRREVPLLKSPLPFLRAQGERIAINAPIQGTSADILKLAMIDTDAYIEEHNLESRVSLLVQIHDELVFEVDETIKDEIQENIVSILQNVLSKRKLSTLPLTVEASCGANLKSV
jgi:DNA polymerase-1